MTTTTTPTVDRGDLHTLAYSGDTLPLDDGRMLRMRTEPDQDATVNDFDCYGRTAWVERDRWTGHDRPRPEGFDGRARKLSTGGGDSFWWQPPADVTERAALDHLAHLVAELMTYGFSVVVLELLDGRDAYGRPTVVAYATVGGVDDPYPELLDDLAAQLGLDVTGD